MVTLVEIFQKLKAQGCGEITIDSIITIIKEHNDAQIAKEIYYDASHTAAPDGVCIVCDKPRSQCERQGEISVVEMVKAVIFHCMPDSASGGDAQKLLAELRPYLRTTEPVLVCQKCDDTGRITTESIQCDCPAAGIKYVD